MSRAPAPDGVLLVDKPAGPTSHDLVGTARRAFGERRIGHAGTLDPFATGLLLLCLGRATRLVEYLHGFPKVYRAEAQLGVATDSQDLDGEVTGTDEHWRTLDRDAVERALEGFLGTSLQTPPVFSAKKVDGRPAHRRVREGETVELTPVPIHIHRMALEEWAPPFLRFEVEVSTGTYIRSLARDVGERLGTGAHLTALRRTSVGPFSVERAVAPEGFTSHEDVARAWISPLQALAHLPSIALTSEQMTEVIAGRGLGPDVALPKDAGEGDAVALAFGEALIAVAEWKGERLHPRKVFPPENGGGA